MNREISVKPTLSPLDFDEVKNFLKVVDDDDDTLIANLIDIAMEQFNHKTYRTALTTTYKLYLDRFPCGRTINLTAPPIQSVTAVKYLDEDSNWQTLADTKYRTITAEDSGSVILLDDYTWPTDLLSGLNVVEIEYIAGWTSADNIPEKGKQWMMCFITDCYENRQSDTPMQVNKHKFIDGLLDSLEVPWELKS
jgi:uncharacterized phiE125 gp8 family phage protein